MRAEACRVRIDLSYDGGGFSGWARQPGQRTVQQVLEDALTRVLRVGPVQLTVAGRTDAGVHARGQVAHADLPAMAWLEAAPALLRRLAGLLPPDVRVRRVAPAPDGFDARFSALSRCYSYRVCDDVTGPDPLRRHDTLWYRHGVDVGAINEAAGLLLGEHDFAAFCRRREGATTVRELLSLSWARPEPTVAEATVVADAFCHSMVRALVGALLKVGEGARPPSWPAQVLTGRVRDPAVPVVPPHGLCLEEVRYPPPGQLAQRALATRRVRPAVAERAPGEPPPG
ncbi:MAG: tRNA pseudouridine38-40 synthase [Streptosporangiaceae bacterium]|nr:tRNA pseudouridine38-40 synthase [Streptosporangiaceae bacterium]